MLSEFATHNKLIEYIALTTYTLHICPELQFFNFNLFFKTNFLYQINKYKDLKSWTKKMNFEQEVVIQFLSLLIKDISFNSFPTLLVQSQQ